jgi:Predicted membrane protein (DUF2127)
MRPLGITLSSYFQFVRAALLTILALAIKFVGSMASRLVALAAEGSGIQRFLSGFGNFIFVVLLVYALIIAILGVGLLLQQNWARMLTILFSGLGVVTLLPRFIHFHPFSFLFGALNLAVLVYLLLPQTRFYFERKSGTEIKPA